MTRKFFALLMTIALACGFATSTAAKDGHDFKNVVVLGIDGMDPKLLQTFVAKGVMPLA